LGIVGLIASVGVFMLAGYLVTGLYGLARAERLLFSYAAGCGVVSLQMFCYSLLGVRLGFFVIAAPWCALWAIGRFAGRWGRGGRWGRAEVPSPVPARPLRRLEWFLVAVIVSQAAFSLFNSAALPVQGFDTWVIWFMKAKVFYMDRGVEYASFLKPLYSNGNPGAYSYPLLTPLATAFSYLAMGGVDDRMAKLLYALYYLSLLGIFYHFVRAEVSREAALVSTAMLATVPRIMEQAGLTGVGYADLPLAVYFISAAGFAFKYMDSGKSRDFLLCALFLSLGAWTKNEGLSFLIIGLALLCLHALFKDPRAAARPVLVSALTVAAVAGPWIVYRSALPEISEGHVTGVSFGSAVANLSRLPTIVSTILPRLFTANKYHAAWGVYVLFAVLAAKRFREKGYALLHLLLWGQFAAYVFVYIVTPRELKPLIRASVDRLTIHLLPLVFFCVALCWESLFGDPDGPGSVRG